MSVYNVNGSQNEFVDSVTRVFILRMRSLGQNGPLRRDAVFALARIAIKKHTIWSPCEYPQSLLGFRPKDWKKSPDPITKRSELPTTVNDTQH